MNACATVVAAPRAVARPPALQRKCACKPKPRQLAPEACESCSAPESFAISSPEDSHEREADQVADRIVSSNAGESNDMRRSPRVGDATRASTGLQRLASSAPPTHAPPSVTESLQTPGRPLDLAVRRLFEGHLGHDFASVRIHADDAAERSTAEVDAQAFTVGHHIVFAPGAYQPSTRAGRRLLAHEVVHVVQQSRGGAGLPTLLRKGGRGPGGCGLLAAADPKYIGRLIHIQIQGQLAKRGLVPELPIPRGTKEEGLDSSRCMPPETETGFADLAKIGTNPIGVAEIKPFGQAGTRGRKEARHYRRRADHVRQRLTRTGRCGRSVEPPEARVEDLAFAAAVLGINRATKFELLHRAIRGVEDFGPFVLDRKKNLKARQVGAGAVGYWCKLNEKGKKKKQRDKKKREQAKAKKRKMDSGKKGGKPGKPAKPKAKPAAKPKAGGSGANLGFGVAIFGTSVGGGNFGFSASVGSNTASAGTAGLSAAWLSDSDSVATAGASVTGRSSVTSAGAFGLAAGDEVESVGGLSVTAAKAKDTSAQGGAEIGSATIEKEAAGGDTEAAAGRAKGSASTASDKKIDPADVTGPDADKTPPGESDEEVESSQGDGEGGEGSSRAGADRSDDTEAAGDAKGRPGAEAGAGGDRAGGGGGDRKGRPGAPGRADPEAPSRAPDDAATGSGGDVEVVALPVFPLGATEEQRKKAGREAKEVAALLAKAEAPQKLLLLHLSQSDPKGQYLVPTADWVDRLLTATQGLSAEDMEYLKTLDWQPSTLSAEELRQRIEETLANRPEPGATGEAASEGDDRQEKGSDDAKAKDAGAEKASGKEGGTGAGKGRGGRASKGSGSATGKKRAAATSGTAKAGKAEASPEAGVDDTASDPPTDVVRTTKAIFSFWIVRGLTAGSKPEKGKVISCTVRITDEGRTFKLKKVKITFEKRVPSTKVEADGSISDVVTQHFYFTNDFWSEKNQFLGKGGPESLTSQAFVVPRKR